MVQEGFDRDRFFSRSHDDGGNKPPTHDDGNKPLTYDDAYALMASLSKLRNDNQRAIVISSTRGDDTDKTKNLQDADNVLITASDDVKGTLGVPNSPKKSPDSIERPNSGTVDDIQFSLTSEPGSSFNLNR